MSRLAVSRAAATLGSGFGESSRLVLLHVKGDVGVNGQTSIGSFPLTILSTEVIDLTVNIRPSTRTKGGKFMSEDLISNRVKKLRDSLFSNEVLSAILYISTERVDPGHEVRI